MSFMRKILDALKMESTREMENTADVFALDAQTAYFINGKLYKLYPSDLDNWYDVRYLVSDNKVYDLEKVEDIKRIPIPKFRRLKTDRHGKISNRAENKLSALFLFRY